MKEEILKQLKKLNQQEKEKLFFNFVCFGNLTIHINHETFQADSVEIVEAFIESGIDVNIKNPFGATPLFYAQSKEIIELLIQFHADLDAKNNIDETPVEYHRYCNNHELADFIEQKAFEKATKLEQEKLNQVLPQPQKSSNHPQYRL